MTMVIKTQTYAHKKKFIDLFAGIGGFQLAFHNLGAECVFASEINEHARRTYEANFRKLSPKLFKQGKGNFARDIAKVDSSTIPDFDILCAGFPCQPFSQAGAKRGFYYRAQNRGNMFFEIIRIIRDKKPAAFILENVSHLKNHNKGRTIAIMRSLLEDLGYSFSCQVVRASSHGFPQHRPRLFMVGFRFDLANTEEFQFPAKESLQIFISDILGGVCNKKVGFTIRVGGAGSGINDRRN